MEYNKEQIEALGVHLAKLLASYITDRYHLELQWLRNLRQYRGIYDPEIEKKMVPARSKAYPRDTRVKVKGGVAKMMEMMFPSQEKNWTLEPSPNPTIPKEALDSILLQVRDELEEGADVDELIERRIREYAKKKAELMEAEISDQLSDAGIDYPQLCKRVVRSGYLYGPGIVRSPMVRKQEERTWKLDEATGEFKAETKTVRRPYPEFVRIWDCYPDLAAKTWEEQEMMFERFVLSRNRLRELADRNDFMAERIKDYLRDHTSGNYTAKTYETALREIEKTSNLADQQARHYEVYRALGFVSGHQLQACGIELSEAELADDVFVDVWFIDNVVIKAQKSAFGDRPSDQYHAFIYTEDEDCGLTGIGLPEEVRDSQMTLCASTRAMMDNMAACCGPIFEVNESLLASGRKTIGDIHAFMVIPREGDMTDAQHPAVRPIQTNSHIPEIQSIINMQRQQLDIESNLPAYTMGAMQNQPLGEAFRTSNNMSMMMGSANMVTKDTVRAFDKFNASVIRSMLKWNMQFNTNEKLKGDFYVVPKGNLSLVAKEVRGAALDQFMLSLDPEEKAMLDKYGLLIDRLKSRDLPADRVLPRNEAQKIVDGLRAAASKASEVEQGFTMAKTAKDQAAAKKLDIDAEVTAASADAVMQEIVSRIEANMANARSVEDRHQMENLKVLLSTLKPEGKSGATNRRDTETA